MKRIKFPEDPKIASVEVITDQSDPQMIKFRREQSEFELGHPRKTVKLEITQYQSGPDGMKLETVIGYYEGAPTAQYTAFFSELIETALRTLREK